MGDLSSANIETRVMPGALHVEALKIAFGERAERCPYLGMAIGKSDFDVADLDSVVSTL